PGGAAVAPRPAAQGDSPSGGDGLVGAGREARRGHPRGPRGRQAPGGAAESAVIDRIAGPVAPPEAAVKPTDIRVEDLAYTFEDYRYRTPIKFGGTAVDRVTLLDVTCVVRTRAGKTARGRGSMPLGNVWSFPSRRLSYDETLAAMKELAGRVARLTAGC